jgi:hypothetical protein
MVVGEGAVNLMVKEGLNQKSLGTPDINTSIAGNLKAGCN